MASAMSSLPAKRAILSFLFSSPRCHHLAIITPLLRYPLSTRTQSQSKELPFIARYLISSFDFSPNRALKVSADPRFASINSPERPEAVVKFLTDTGLSDAQVKSVVSFQPRLLTYNVEKNLKTKVSDLINGGCSGELLVQLIRYCPQALLLNNTLSRFRFLRDFVGKDDQALLKIIRLHGFLISYNIDKQIAPRINLLKEYGLSNSDIVFLLLRGVRCLNQNINSLRKRLALIEELGILRGSKMFRGGLKAVGGLSEDTIKRRLEFFKKTYGWSQKDLCVAFRKFPNLLSCSEDNVRSKMDFLTGKAGFDPRSIASYPVLIGCGLGVLIPRYTVLSALEAEGLKKSTKISNLSTACQMSQEKFYERYIVPFEKDVPGLHQAFVASYCVEGQV